MHDTEHKSQEKKTKKTYMLMVLGVLMKYSDEENPLSQAEIGRLVEKEYGEKIYDRNTNKKTLRDNLIALRDFLHNADFGYTLEHSDKEKMVAHTFKEKETKLIEGTSSYGWYLDRDISNAELIPLIDSLLFSKCIPYSAREKLIENLKGLSSIHFKRDIKLPENILSNKQFFYNIELLSEAISKGKRVSFNMIYFEADHGGKPRIHPGKDDSPHLYKVSPYEIIITNGRYYLICANSAGSNLCHYRIEYIHDLKFLKKNENGEDIDENHIPNRPMKEMKGHENGIDLKKYMREHIYMYNGDSVPIEFIADKTANPSIVNQIIDWFGDAVTFSKETQKSVIARVTVNEKAMLYWALQFGKSVEILKPQSLRDEVAEAIKGMWEKYSV